MYFHFFYCRCRWVLLEEPFYPTVKKRYNTSSIFYRSLTSDTIIHFCLLQPSMKHIHLNYTILGKLNKPRVNYVSHKRFFLSFGAENDYVSCETCNNVKCVYFGFHVEFLYYMQYSFGLSSTYLFRKYNSVILNYCRGTFTQNFTHNYSLFRQFQSITFACLQRFS